MSGPLVELDKCNEDVSCTQPRDCVLGEWLAWSDCSCTCDGIRHRSRPIQVSGNGDATYCNASLEELQPCNPSLDGRRPVGCEAPEIIDCVFEEWQNWLPCEVTCGGGQRSRARNIRIPSKGGKQCQGDTLQLEPCNTQACNYVPPVDCKWGSWDSWSDCGKCDGQKHRKRVITVHNAHGGKACVNVSSEETDGCDSRNCHKFYCSWQDWGGWSQCTNVCGAGSRSRTRTLNASSQKPQIQKLYDQFTEDNLEMESRAKNLESGRIQEMIVSFSAGALCLLVVLALSRAFQSTRASSGQRQEYSGFEQDARGVHVQADIVE